MTPSKCIVPVLICLVAAAQMTLARYSTLTPGKGGGFGMFASVDSPSNRYLSIVGFDASLQPHTIDVPWGRFSEPEPLTMRFARRTLAFPSRPRLKAIAEAVLNANLRVSTRPRRPPTSLLASPYRVSLETGLRAGHLVDVVGPYRDEGSITGLRRIEATVLMVDFSVETGRVAFQPLSAYGSVDFDPLSARR